MARRLSRRAFEDAEVGHRVLLVRVRQDRISQRTCRPTRDAYQSRAVSPSRSTGPLTRFPTLVALAMRRGVSGGSRTLEPSATSVAGGGAHSAMLEGGGLVRSAPCSDCAVGWRCGMPDGSGRMSPPGSFTVTPCVEALRNRGCSDLCPVGYSIVTVGSSVKVGRWRGLAEAAEAGARSFGLNGPGRGAESVCAADSPTDGSRLGRGAFAGDRQRSARRSTGAGSSVPDRSAAADTEAGRGRCRRAADVADAQVAGVHVARERRRVDRSCRRRHDGDSAEVDR